MGPPGMLYVTMQPNERLAIDQFHEWYNNEHGPLRLRKPHIFPNGLRYKATDGIQPDYLAAYDVTDMDKLTTPEYTKLRENRSPRERAVVTLIDIKRYFFDLGSVKQAPDFVPAEQLSDLEALGRVLVAVEVTLNDADGAEAAVTKWYEEEHFDMLSKVPGWLRSRLYLPSSLEGSSAPRKIITLHEYSEDNGLEGPEHKASMATPWRDDVFSKYITSKARRTYSLFYIFGSAPRDLWSLSRLPAFGVPKNDMATATSGPKPKIQSSVTTSDGLTIPYQLEGNASPGAPTIAFCNSLLTSLHMWDPFVEILLKLRPDVRILRYNTRGRGAMPAVPATMDQLADDLATLLEALRIPQLHALIGVSIGGVTALNFALKYPTKLTRFIACDFNVAGSEANTQSWKDRIAIAEEQGMRVLAGQTVERWFHPDTIKDKKEVADWMTDMVAENDVQGFKYSCQALWNYDLKPQLRKCTGWGLLVVGESDGKGALVKAMQGFQSMITETGLVLRIVPRTGHLPMCEDPQAFWEVVASFLV